MGNDLHDWWYTWTTTRDIEINVGLFVFALISTIVITSLFIRHIYWWRRDYIQKCYLRVILMVPVFSWLSFVSLLHPSLAVFCAVFRGLYEAYALWAFFAMMTIYAGGENRVLTSYEEFGNRFTLLGLCTCCTFDTPQGLLNRSKLHVRQFLVTRPFILLLLALLTVLHIDRPVFVLGLKFINMAFTILVIQTIINSYLATSNYLFGFGAAKKVLFIKVSVGFTIVQEIVIGVLVPFHIIKPTEEFTEDEVATRMLAALVIMEQVFFAVLAYWAYGHRDSALREEMSLTDFQENEPNPKDEVQLTNRTPCSACYLVFSFVDICSGPLEEHPFASSDAPTRNLIGANFQSELSEEERKLRRERRQKRRAEKEKSLQDNLLRSAQHSRQTREPSIFEADYDDTAPRSRFEI